MKKETSNKVKVYIREALIILGAILVWYGLYMIYEPISYIVLGGGLVWFGFPKQAVK